MPTCRIALLFEFPTLNGGERSMLAAIDWLRDNDRRFEFIAIAPPVGRLADALRGAPIPLIAWTPFDSTGQRLSAGTVESSLLNTIDVVYPDLLHANSLSMGRLTGRLATRLTIPTTAHLRDIIKLSQAAAVDLGRNARLIAVSDATRQFHAAQGIDGNRICVVHNGLDLDQFQPRTATGRLHESLGLLSSAQANHGTQVRATTEPSAASAYQSVASVFDRPRLIAMIGQIGLRKGQDILTAAAPMIVDRIPSAHFLIIGERSSQKPESLEFEQAIQRGFATSKLADHLHLLGHRDDIAVLLNEIDLLVHPANQEPFGRVLLEASASGVPIVATDVGGTSEIIVDGQTGILIPPRDPAALAAAVIDLLTDDGKARQFGEAARNLALHEFAISIAAHRLAITWTDILNA